ncbi:MAG: N-acetyl-gamma-glutamyl-phosphate reductase [Bacteroidales bacterium]|nr:N-acetyl-gamma-glutamyl-phosphate reductase [Bacteroidales bacterium]
MIQAGIVGGTGYVAGELIRILINHQEVNIDFVYSHSQSGKKVMDVHQDLFTNPELQFTDKINPEVNVVFLCLGHGNSMKFLNEHQFSESTKIVDLSNDFRLKENAVFQNKKFVYGLVEKNRELIEKAQFIANPGCFATAIQLGLLPLAAKGLLQDEVHIHGITGSTGAGNSMTETTHFSWRNNNVSIYKPFTHQHLGEIGETLASFGTESKSKLNFIPVRGNFTRGILVSIYTNCDLPEEQLVTFYKTFYKESVFTVVSDKSIHLKQVVNTNYGLLHVEKHESKVLITSVIDNLLKGAAGQAVENMNLMFGFAQNAGLILKPNYF